MGNLQDQLTPGVKITRGSASGGLYNSVTESKAISGSPGDTKWAVGALSNFNTLTYGSCPLEAGNHPPGKVGTTYVVHLINEDIYLSLKLTAWGGAGMTGDRSFSYTRSTPSLTPPTPTISITNPVSGAVFVAPANVTFQADAAVSSGTVTNVQFFTNGISAGSILAAPFNLTVDNLAAGPYALTAVATAAGISATSSVVNMTVNSPVSPPMVSITNPADGAVFAAPASISIGADAEVSSGTVTNVEFFANGTSQGTVAVAPFTVISSPLAAGPYALTAVATASGISTTSTVVNVSVVNPVPVNLAGSMVSGDRFIFSYTADAGLAYVVQTSSNLVDWLSLMTNLAPGSLVLFTNALNPPGPSFYRVGRLPNP
jgi:Bacterial Ig domain